MISQSFHFKIISVIMYRNTERKPLPQPSERYSPMRQGNSPTKASVLVLQDCQEYVQSLITKKQNLNTCLDLYKLSYDNQIPQKCFPHNNFITLYCQNEKKLLCVNCIYQSALHKTHRVVPSKNSLKNIMKDNEDSLRYFQEELTMIKSSEAQVGKNSKSLNDEYKRVIDTINKQFEIMYRIIQKKHQQMKENAMRAFSRAKQNNDIGKQQILWWKNYLSNFKINLPKESGDQQTEIYKHLVFQTLRKQQVDLQKLTYIASPQQITEQFVRQAVQLRQMLELKVSGKQPTRAQKGKIRMF